MSRHDEPNEYGFAGEGTAPEPQPRGDRDQLEADEREAVPGGDLSGSLREALEDATEGGRERPAGR